MSVKNRILAEPLRTLNANAINAVTFTAINTGGLLHPSVLLRIVNDSNTTITISYDGVTAHDYVPSNSSITEDFQINGQPNNFVAQIAKGTVIYARGTAGVGTLVVASYYQPQG